MAKYIYIAQIDVTQEDMQKVKKVLDDMLIKFLTETAAFMDLPQELESSQIVRSDKFKVRLELKK